MSEALRPLFVAEPAPSLYAAPRAVVDASVVCAAVFSEPERPDALAKIRACAPVVPDLLPYEVANAAVMKVRRGLPLNEAKQALQRLLSLNFDIITADAAATFDLAIRFRLSAYDAAYLWLARELRAPLLTFDEKLAAAAASYLQ